MSAHHRRPLRGAAIAATLLLGAACADGSDEAATPAGTPTEGVEADAPDPARPDATPPGDAEAEDAEAEDAEVADAGPDADGTTVTTVEDGSELAFAPDRIDVEVGETVTFVNEGELAHTVSGDGLNSGQLDPGDDYTVTLDEPGEITYLCYFHPEMTGTITVG